MECPICNGPMWDNRINKKNPKGPDWKCKDKQCAHAVWLEKKALQPPKPPIPTNVKDKTDARAMIMAYAKDLVIGRLEAGEKVVQPVKSTIMTFRLLWREYLEPFTVQFKEDEG